jgi:hypothetical protein
MASANMLSDTASYIPGGRVSQFYADGTSGPGQLSPIPGYDQYLAGGQPVNRLSDIQTTPRMSPSIDADAALPQHMGYVDARPVSQHSQSSYTPGVASSVSQQFPTTQPRMPSRQSMHSMAPTQMTSSTFYHNAEGNFGEEVHRPYTPVREMSSQSWYSDNIAPQQYPPGNPMPAPYFAQDPNNMGPSGR